MRPVAPLLALAILLAGCSQGPAAPAEIIVESKPIEEVTSDTPVQAVFTPSPKSRGHIAGVVVDEAIRPIENATVRLPGLDLERPTDRDGSFGFVDLHPGPYYVLIEREGYYAAEATVEVAADEFTRVKVVLKAIPPPDPYRVMQSWDGYAEVTQMDTLFFVWGLFCTVCEFEAYVDPVGLHDIVLEAVLDSGAASNGFTFRVSQGEFYAAGKQGNPMLFQRKVADLDPNEDLFTTYIEPTSFPVPETGKSFQVFLTAFYNEDPPVGWSFVAGG
jgi:Carboxypeptidase regulatory-like domain